MQSLKGHGKLTAEDIDAAMREIRLALLEADVQLQGRARLRRARPGAGARRRGPGEPHAGAAGREDRQRRAGRRSWAAATPSSPSAAIRRPSSCWSACRARARPPPAPSWPSCCQEGRQAPVLVAADVYRPAAIDQLETLGRAARRARCTRPARAPIAVDSRARRRRLAQRAHGDLVIIDTAGRLHIDEELMASCVNIARRRDSRTRSCSCVDAMTGQDAVNVAEAFDGRVDLDGVDPHQAGRRRPRRRGALAPRRHRQADQVRRHRREARRPRAVPPRPHGRPHPRHGRRALASSRRPRSTLDEQAGGGAGGEAAQAPSSPGGLPRPAAAGAQDGLALQLLGMLPGVPGMKELEERRRSTTAQLDRIEAIIPQHDRRRSAGTPNIIDGSRRRRIARGQRHLGPGRQPAAQAVPRDAEDAEDVLRAAA